MERPQTEAAWQNVMAHWLNSVDHVTNELINLSAHAAPDSFEADIAPIVRGLRDRIDLDSALRCTTPALMAQWYAHHWEIGNVATQEVLSQILMTGRSPIRALVAQLQLLKLYEATTPEHHTALAVGINALYELWHTHVLLVAPEFFAPIVPDA